MEKILFTLQQLQKDQVDFRGEMNERLNRIEENQIIFETRLTQLQTQTQKQLIALNNKVEQLGIRVESMRDEINLINYTYETYTQSNDQSRSFLLSLLNRIKKVEAKLNELED